MTDTERALIQARQDIARAADNMARATIAAYRRAHIRMIDPTTPAASLHAALVQPQRRNARRIPRAI